MKCPNCKQTIKLIETTCPYCGYSREIDNKENKTIVLNDESTAKEYDKWVKDKIQLIRKTNIAGCILGICVSILFIVIALFAAKIGTEEFEYEALAMLIIPAAIIPLCIIGMKQKCYDIKEYNNSTFIAYSINYMFYIYMDSKELVSKYVYKKRIQDDYIRIDAKIPGTDSTVEALFRNGNVKINIIEKSN